MFKLKAAVEYLRFINILFPFPRTGDHRIPDAVSRINRILLEKTSIEEHVHFHDLCYTFATIALGNEMDVKPLSTMLGHVSVATTLDIYTHITNLMRSEAAKKIEQRIGKVAPQESLAEPQEKRMMTTFQPYIGGKRRYTYTTQSSRTAGRSATPLYCRMIRSTPEMCTPTPPRNMRRNSKC